MPPQPAKPEAVPKCPQLRKGLEARVAGSLRSRLSLEVNPTLHFTEQVTEAWRRKGHSQEHTVKECESERELRPFEGHTRSHQTMSRPARMHRCTESKVIAHLQTIISHISLLTGKPQL